MLEIKNVFDDIRNTANYEQHVVSIFLLIFASGMLCSYEIDTKLPWR